MLFLPAINVKMIVSSGFFGLVDSILPLYLKKEKFNMNSKCVIRSVLWLFFDSRKRMKKQVPMQLKDPDDKKVVMKITSVV